MQFSIYINQMRSLEWGLNLSQSALFAFLYEAQSWAEQIIIDGDTYYWVAKEKVIEELPILTDKPNTIRKLLVDIERLELISRAVRNNKPVFRVTEKGKLWNRTEGGKKIPTKAKSKAGKKSAPKSDQGQEKNPDLPQEEGGKKIPTGSGNNSHQGQENNPPNHNTSDQPTIDQSKKPAPAARSARTKKAQISYLREDHDFTDWTNAGIPNDVIDAWLINRQNKNLAVTALATASTLKSLQVSAAQHPRFTLVQILTIAINAGWGGFEPNWFTNRIQRDGIQSTGNMPLSDHMSTAWAQQPGGKPAFSSAEASVQRLKDTSWGDGV